MANLLTHNQPQLQNNGWFPSGIPWAEAVGFHGDHGPKGSFSYQGNSHMSLSIWVYWEDGIQAVIDLLGTNFYDLSGGSPGVLRRVPPMQHPIMPWMFCTTIIDMTPVAWVKKGIFPDAYAAFPDNTQTQPVCSNYDRWLITAGFEVPKFAVLTDIQMANRYGTPWQEWQRFVEWPNQPVDETLIREAGSFTFAEGPAGVVGNPFQSPTPQQIPNSEVHATWKRVPRNGLFVPGTDWLNINITSRYKTLNQATFLNQPKGTLRFEGAIAHPLPSPVPPQLQGIVLGNINCYYDVDMIFSYRNPPPFGINKGHNIAPFPSQAPGTSGQWGLVTVDGTPTGASIFAYSDFTQIFQLTNQ